MCFYIILLISLILSLVIVHTIKEKPKEIEGFERCLCSPLGEPQCSVYTGPSQYNKNYAYDNYGGPSTLSSNVIYSGLNNVVGNSPSLSQADRGYTNLSNNIPSQNNNLIFAQSKPFLSGGISQADRGYNIPPGQPTTQSGISYGKMDSDTVYSVNAAVC